MPRMLARRHCISLAAVLFLYVVRLYAVDGEILYSLSGDWSNTKNPNDSWSYRQGFAALPSVFNWQGAGTAPLCGQPAWAPTDVPSANASPSSNQFVPAWFQATSCTSNSFGPDPNNSKPNVMPGDIIVRTNDNDYGNTSAGGANVVFTMPSASRPAVYTIRGKLWNAHLGGQMQQWGLTIRRASESKIRVPAADGLFAAGALMGAVSRSRPEVFDVNVPLQPGDEVMLTVAYADVARGDFVGVQVTIEFAPPLIVLANLSNNVYFGNGGFGEYKFVGNNCTFPPNTCTNFGFAGAAYANPSESQVVIAIRGTVPDHVTTDDKLELFDTIAADATFCGGNPSRRLIRFVEDAVAFLQAVQKKYPEANITIAGHSLGGAIAQLVGSAAGLPTFAFNAPGTGSVAEGLSAQLSPLVKARLAKCTGSNTATCAGNIPTTQIDVNYRLYGEQISLFDEPMDSTITLRDPPYTTLKVNGPPLSFAAFAVLVGTFWHLHTMDTMIAQIADNAPETSSIGEPNFASVIEQKICGKK